MTEKEVEHLIDARVRKVERTLDRLYQKVDKMHLTMKWVDKEIQAFVTALRQWRPTGAPKGRNDGEREEEHRKQ